MVKITNLKLSTFTKQRKPTTYKHESAANAFSGKLLPKMWKSQTTASKENIRYLLS